MKKEDVPQDDENLLEGKIRLLEYAVDEQGKYVTSPSAGWAPKNTALKQAWEVIHEKVAAVKELVLAGELSPLAYHMEKGLMDVGLLAQHTGFFRWTVKGHLKPKNFAKLKQYRLERYAKALKITVEELKKVD